jgi:hypothetical protein
MRKSSTPRRRTGENQHPFLRIEAHPRVLAAGIAALVSLAGNMLYHAVDDFAGALRAQHQAVDCKPEAR